ncbi:hypothetical protein MTO96_034351 [Rhipicephalus appendiculatus]
MTTKDLDALDTALARLRHTKLLCLSFTTILENFTTFGPTSKRRILQKMPEDALSPWQLYRVDPFKVTLIYFALHRRIARALAIPGYPIQFVPIDTSNRRSACIIVTDTVPTNEHRVICVCVWDSLTYVAVWAAESVRREYFQSALASALCGNPEDLRIGSYGTLEVAYAEARQDAMAPRAPS